MLEQLRASGARVVSLEAGVLLLARAETRGADRAAERVRSRALAWSGVQAIVADPAFASLRAEAERLESGAIT